MSSTKPLTNIVTEHFRKSNRVALSRLVYFELSWEYADGIWSGVVWVAGKEDSANHIVPLWYQCVQENMLDTCARSWYRKHALYEMTPEQLDKVRSMTIVKALALRGPFQCCHISGMPLSPTKDEYLLRAEMEDLLGVDGINSAETSWRHAKETLWHTDKLYGWFQR